MARLAERPLAALGETLACDALIDPETIGDSPSWKGAYVLAILLENPVEFARGAMSHSFDPGWYAYCGSAYGPGGVSARLRRHFKPEKTLHWHVDSLTTRASRLEAIACRGGTECDLVAALCALEGFHPALDGFGSSDCARCPSHLLVWRGG